MKYKTYKELPVWQEAHKYVLNVYKLSSSFPKPELFALTSQLRRSSVSITSNIAEGFGRKTTKELIQFLFHAKGSLLESEYQLFLAKDLKYISVIQYKNIYQLFNSIHKQLNSWIKTLKNKLT
jgi:four helix bundle protein